MVVALIASSRGLTTSLLLLLTKDYFLKIKEFYKIAIFLLSRSTIIPPLINCVLHPLIDRTGFNCCIVQVARLVVDKILCQQSLHSFTSLFTSWSVPAKNKLNPSINIFANLQIAILQRQTQLHNTLCLENCHNC